LDKDDVVSASPLEEDAILVSRLLGDRDRVMIGAGLDAPRAGALLAALTHAPGLAVCQALAWLDPASLATLALARSGMDLRDAAGAEALVADDEAYDDVRRLSTFFVIGGLEIDRRGATNLLGIHDGRRWVKRGPGAIGTTSMAVLASRRIVYSRRHTAEVFVERCALVSAHGWSTRRAAAPGPELCISSAGVFDFPPPERQMRLLHWRRGWSPERVQEETGFPLAGLDTATLLPPPDAAELRTLRERVDREGVLR
jgi:glutaconate CoA-transferase subunit B